MTLRIVSKCIDCKQILSPNPRRNKHHFRCDKCWLEYMADYDKHKIRFASQQEKEQ